MQWHTLPVEAYGMTHTALHGRLPRILWITGNIQSYTRINLRAYGATPTTLQHSTDTVRSHGVEIWHAELVAARANPGTLRQRGALRRGALQAIFLSFTPPSAIKISILDA